jgi:hypothetical protein
VLARWPIASVVASRAGAWRAAANNDRVELQVQLSGQIERHPFGPLPIPHDLIMVRPGEFGGLYVCELLVSLPVSSA